MKNAKLIALVAVLVVITMVISIVVASNMNKATQEQLDKNQAAANEHISSLEQTINKLNGTISDLQNGIKDAEETAKAQAELIEQLKQWGIEIENWNEATKVLVEKIAELRKAISDYETAKDEKGNLILNKNDFTFLGWDKTVYGEEAPVDLEDGDGLYGVAVKDLMRATSVEEMDKIIADCLAKVKAIRTNIEVLYDTVAAIEADGVTADDKDNVVKVLKGNWLDDSVISLNKYEGETVKARTEAKAALVKRFSDALKTYKTAAAEKYVAMVAALPTVDGVKITDYYRYVADTQVSFDDAVEEAKYVIDEKAALSAAKAQYQHLVDTYANGGLNLTFVRTSDPVNRSLNKTNELLARIEILKGLKITTDRFNYNISCETFVGITGKNFHNTFGLNLDTISTIKFYEDYIAQTLMNWEDSYDVVLEPGKVGFNEYLYNFFDHSIMEGYRANYSALVEVLAANAQAYIEAVENTFAQTTYTDIDAANVLADAAFKTLKATKGLTLNTSVATIDVLLENEENEVAKAAADHTVIATELGTIKNKVALLDKHVHETILKLKHVKNCEGGNKCVCTEMVYDETKLNYDTIKNVVNKHLKPIITTDRAFEEDVIGAELLADLKAAFVQAAKNKVEASVKAWAASVSLDEGLETQVITQITTLYFLDLDSVVFSATYTEPTYDFEGNVVTPGSWDWSAETKAYFATVDAYCDTALYNDIYNGIVNP